MKERLEASSLPNKDELIMSMMELTGDEMDEDRGTGVSIDRGVLE